METFSTLLAFVRGINRSPVDSPHEKPVTRSFGIFFDLHLNKRFSKHSKYRCIEAHGAHYNVTVMSPTLQKRTSTPHITRPSISKISSNVINYFLSCNMYIQDLSHIYFSIGNQYLFTYEPQCSRLEYHARGLNADRASLMAGQYILSTITEVLAYKSIPKCCEPKLLLQVIMGRVFFF